MSSAEGGSNHIFDDWEQPRALSLMSFPLTLVVGYIVVDMFQGLRLLQLLVLSLAYLETSLRKKKKKTSLSGES